MKIEKFKETDPPHRNGHSDSKTNFRICKTENKIIKNPKVTKKPKNAIRSKKIEKLKKTKENN